MRPTAEYEYVSGADSNQVNRDLRAIKRVCCLITSEVKMISKKLRAGMPWELLHADDLAVIDDCEEEVTRKLNL